jgi:hypothetical protein
MELCDHTADEVTAAIVETRPGSDGLLVDVLEIREHRDGGGERFEIYRPAEIPAGQVGVLDGVSDEATMLYGVFASVAAVHRFLTTPAELISIERDGPGLPESSSFAPSQYGPEVTTPRREGRMQTHEPQACRAARPAAPEYAGRSRTPGGFAGVGSPTQTVSAASKADRTAGAHPMLRQEKPRRPPLLGPVKPHPTAVLDGTR